MKNLYTFIKYIEGSGASSILLDLVDIYDLAENMWLELKRADVSDYVDSHYVFSDGNISCCFSSNKCVVSVGGVVRKEFAIDAGVYSSLLMYVFEEYPMLLDYLGSGVNYRYRVEFKGNEISVLDI